MENISVTKWIIFHTLIHGFSELPREPTGSKCFKNRPFTPSPLHPTRCVTRWDQLISCNRISSGPFQKKRGLGIRRLFKKQLRLWEVKRDERHLAQASPALKLRPSPSAQLELSWAKLEFSPLETLQFITLLLNKSKTTSSTRLLTEGTIGKTWLQVFQSKSLKNSFCISKTHLSFAVLFVI